MTEPMLFDVQPKRTEFETILDRAPWAAFCVRHSCIRDDHQDCPSYARKAFKRWVNEPLREFAEAIHEQCCDMWAQAAHGGYFANLAEEHCGENAAKHVDAYTRTRWVIELHERYNPPLFEVAE